MRSLNVFGLIARFIPSKEKRGLSPLGPWADAALDQLSDARSIADVISVAKEFQSELENCAEKYFPATSPAKGQECASPIALKVQSEVAVIPAVVILTVVVVVTATVGRCYSPTCRYRNFKVTSPENLKALAKLPEHPTFEQLLAARNELSLAT